MTSQKPEGREGREDTYRCVKGGSSCCPRCGQRPKAVSRTGKAYPYCRECWNAYYRELMKKRRGLT